MWILAPSSFLVRFQMNSKIKSTCQSKQIHSKFRPIKSRYFSFYKSGQSHLAIFCETKKRKNIMTSYLCRTLFWIWTAMTFFWPNSSKFYQDHHNGLKSLGTGQNLWVPGPGPSTGAFSKKRGRKLFSKKIGGETLLGCIDSGVWYMQEKYQVVFKNGGFSLAVVWDLVFHSGLRRFSDSLFRFLLTEVDWWTIFRTILSVVQK